MTQDQFRAYLDERCTALCNRYFHAIEDLGVIDRKKSAKLSEDILKARNALLDHWMPIYAADMFQKLTQNGGGDTPESHP